MQFMGSLDGVRARVLLDTGAGGTFISQVFAKRSNIAVVPSEECSAATTVNDSPVQVIGMAIVHLDLQVLHCTICCLVADLGTDWDLIVGEPWLKQHHVVLSYDKQDAVVTKGSQSITLRCGTFDGVDVDPNDPTAAAVGNVPVLSSVQMHRLLQPWHRKFVVHGSGADPKPGVSLGAVSEPVSADTECVQALLREFADCFPTELPDGLPPDRVSASGASVLPTLQLSSRGARGVLPWMEVSPAEVSEACGQLSRPKRCEPLQKKQRPPARCSANLAWGVPNFVRPARQQQQSTWGRRHQSHQGLASVCHRYRWHGSQISHQQRRVQVYQRH